MKQSRRAMSPLVASIVLFLSQSYVVSIDPSKPRSLSFVVYKPLDHINIGQLSPNLKNGFFHKSWQRVSHSHERRFVPTFLSSTTSNRGEKSSNSSSRSRNENAKYNVRYQKVLRAPSTPSSPSSSQSVSSTFLLDLVLFLQNMFEIPDGLPMPYEITVPDYGVEEIAACRAVLKIDSPLSNDPCETCLEVEVVGIFPDSDDTSQRKSNTPWISPTMAMVVVKKNGSLISGNCVTGGLFEASEKRIIQSLDRGLQQFEEGSVLIPSHLSYDPVDKFDDIDRGDEDDDELERNVKKLGYSNTINAAKIDRKGFGKRENGHPSNIERDGIRNVVVDSASKPELMKEEAFSKEPKHRTQNKLDKNFLESNDSRSLKTSSIDSKKEKASSKQTIPNDVTEPQKVKSMVHPKHRKLPSEDYAIQMARKQAEKLMKTAQIGQISSSEKGTIAISGGEGDFAIMAAMRATGSSKRMKQMLTKGQESNASDFSAEKRMYKAKENDPLHDEVLMKLQNAAKSAKRKAWKTTIFQKGSIVGSNDTKIREVPKVRLQSKDEGAGEKSTLSPRPDTSNLRRGKTDEDIEYDIMKIAKENEEIQRDLLKAAMDMMPVEKEGEDGLSPEELLAQVLKFGDEKEKEESPGYGFVEGAFRKAKELLRKNDRRNNLEFKQFDGNPFEGMKFDGNLNEKLENKGEEEELRKIFAKGQSEALERSSNPSTQSSLAKSAITDADIDALIAADDTVPRNARILDNEFVELELRMSRSKGENSGKPTKKEVFDVFSGPETYNPNVDPTTSVNWPGAKEGTRTDVRLASELSTALKQAQFAAAVLSEMRTEDGENNAKYYVGDRELSQDRVNLLQMCVDEAVKAGLIEDPQIKMFERSRLQMLIDELASQPEERFEEISLEYKDLLLSDNLVELFKERLQAMAKRDLEARLGGSEDCFKEIHARERIIMMNLAQLAQGLVKEAQALGAELEVSMLEIVRSICEVAMDPSLKSQEDTAIALTDAVRDIRPLIDDAFVAYLKYAIAEEEGKLARAGILDDPEHNRWLFVLKIVQEGVYAELSRGVKRYVEHIWYVLRMNSKAERKELLKKLIEVMPTMDVRPFVKVVNNVVASLGTTVKGDFADGVILGEMTNKLLQLQRDVGDLLPPERIKELSKDADDWAAAQRKRLLERQKLTRQRLKAARQTGTVDPDNIIQPGVEAERFD
ncbi:hypothetical protein ACHAXS_003621 [Conticribra weissflogii]